VVISGYTHGASGLPDSYAVETVSLSFGRVCLSALNAAGEPIQTNCFLAGS
jgi:hypothetical protein